MTAQYFGMAYILAKRDADEYARLLEAAEKAIPVVIQIEAVTDDLRGKVYAALDDPNGDWCKAVLSWLNHKGPIILTRNQGEQILRHLQHDEPQ
jgi:hypothetical protein